MHRQCCSARQGAGATADGVEAERREARALCEMELLYGDRPGAARSRRTDDLLVLAQPLFLLLAWGTLALLLVVLLLAGLLRERPAAHADVARIDGIRFNDAYMVTSDAVAVFAGDPRRRPAQMRRVATLLGRRGTLLTGSAERAVAGYVPVLLPGGDGVYGWLRAPELRQHRLTLDYQ